METLILTGVAVRVYSNSLSVISVGGNDNIDVLDDRLECLVQLLLQLEKSSEDGLYPLGDGLTEDIFGLHTDA